ncbi:MAG: biotin--[acetyl-CoA-carboxylase] ligase [Chromatiales bacterium]|jgi:BirA family biotin operon repressor/biotin-[acetyl-CoA-carboxylase] ligase|nr:biotin--[acetyl-CoA-carboxylase] ligase [Chromatiales bacterium]MDP7093053.1 biotin--[acetyl-CoA-carboxylase] ligase [Gammaproteobacteria bacterium]MDP7270499.1 biotin--[acetyl-CoA-carboxylase] ligase [Gammaproteobacteria bacterium]HJP05757.1 biotin--[acetyl-CoA-carboxylase] ligase [Gammaproteobacteria bacterium]
MSAQQALLGLLADGGLHSGTELARSLDVTRAAVWKHVKQLESLGLEVGASRGKGYQLAAPLELLDRAKIESALDADTQDRLDSFKLLWTTTSTSDYLLDKVAAEPPKLQACLAEYQAGGRGRRGRAWLSPAGHGLCMSVARLFVTTPVSLSCLGLAVGVGTLRALRACGAHTAQLKWPNDVVIAGQKLAGVLIDVRGETTGPLRVVAGVGVNYLLNDTTSDAIAASGGIPPTSLSQCVEDGPPARNYAAATLLNEVCGALEQFAAAGFAAFADEWHEADYLRGREVSINGDQQIAGIAQGIADDGRLCVQSGGQTHYVVTGDVSVR